MLVIYLLKNICCTYYAMQNVNLLHSTNINSYNKPDPLKNNILKSKIQKRLHLKELCINVLDNAIDDMKKIIGYNLHIDKVDAKILCNDVIYSIFKAYEIKNYVYIPNSKIINLDETYRSSFNSILRLNFEFLTDIYSYEHFDFFLNTLKHDPNLFNAFIKQRMFWKFDSKFLPYVSYTSPKELQLYINIDSINFDQGHDNVILPTMQNFQIATTNIPTSILLSFILSVLALIWILIYFIYKYFKKNQIFIKEQNNLMLQEFYYRNQ